MNRHANEVSGIEELTTEEIREANPGEDLSKLFKSRDNEWSEKAKNILKNNLKYHVNRLENKRDSNQPMKLLEKALNILETVDTNQDTFYDNPTVFECVRKINKISFEMKKLLE